MSRRSARSASLAPLVAGASALPVAWRARADQLERFAPAAAVAFRDAALELERELRAQADAVLTLSEAALASGYSADSIRHKIAAGEIPNVGKRGSPRVRAGDLPRKAARQLSGYDPGADALSLVRRASP